MRKWNKISGFFEPEEVAALQELAVDKVCLEIGTFYGRSTAALAEVAKVVHTVDTHMASGDGARQEKQVNEQRLMSCKNNLAGWSNVTMHIGNSQKIVPEFQDRFFDLVFIDGSHVYEDVLADIKVCIPKVKKRGVMAFHDYGGWPGVTQAVDESFLKEAIQGPAYTLVWVIV